MHSISPYTVRCFNPNLTEAKLEDRYSKLGKVGSFDTYTILKEYLETQDDKYKILEESKQVFRFSKIKCNDTKREISGWMQAGTYGTKNDIIDINTGNVDFQKTQNNALIVDHYIRIWIPNEYNEGIALLHSYKNIGIKTILHTILTEKFNSITQLKLQMNPLAYDKAYNDWQHAAAKEIKLVKFSGLDDLSDRIKMLGHNEQELVFKPPRKGTLGRLADYFNRDSEQFKAIEILSPLCASVKTTVQLNNRKRTFTLGMPASQQVCQIELNEDEVAMIAGNPEPQSLHDWCTTLLKDYVELLYPGIKEGA